MTTGDEKDREEHTIEDGTISRNQESRSFTKSFILVADSSANLEGVDPRRERRETKIDGPLEGGGGRRVPGISYMPIKLKPVLCKEKKKS